MKYRRLRRSATVRVLAFVCLSAPWTASTAWSAPTAQEIQDRFRRFQIDPAFEMNAAIPKQGNPSTVAAPLSREIDPLRAKAAVRRAFLEIDGRGPIDTNDRPEVLADNGASLVRSLQEMERQGLQQSQLPEAPWSDDYWGIYKGVLGARYADAKFPGAEDWKKNFDYVQSPANLAATLIAAPVSERGQSKIEALSPAEKYDLLLGETSFPLTQAMWSEGRRYYEENGKVESWMGICHGWAPASYMVSRPRKAVTVTLPSPQGRRITFFPSDIKGLNSLLWATGSFEQSFIGGRCDVKEPATDPTTGRITDPGCFDTNPGTFHLAMVNQIGISRRGLVVDVTYDYEVWNQPVLGYSYTYFNPNTGVASASAASATIPMSSFSNDKFRRYRSKKAAAVVGVAFTLEYGVETVPSQRNTDSARYDATQTANYLYDLELDERGEIIGGEWYTNLHPDFLWTPKAGTHALSSADWGVAGTPWDGTLPLPANLKTAARSAASRGEPLAALVEALVRLANP